MKTRDEDPPVSRPVRIDRIVSGGQTGADRAALDAAIELDVPHGGWVPRGRRTEDGSLPARYRLKETESPSYPQRTERNVLDSDGTLIFSHGRLGSGSALTGRLAGRHGKPWLHLDLDDMTAAQAAQAAIRWIRACGVRVLNVAGPRASEDRLIYDGVRAVLRVVIAECGGAEPSS
ncbi:MAG: putative molybdenum carrier protein [bacterium]